MDFSSLKIIQWNSRGVMGKIEAKKLFIDYDIIVLTETFLNEGDSYTLKGFNAIRFDRVSNSRGGILFLVKSHIAYNKLDLNILYNFEQIELAAITIDTNLGPIDIIAYYRSPVHQTGHSINTWRHEWKLVIDKVQSLNQVIFLGDFNAHHPWWGSDKACPYGDAIINNIDIEKIALLNDGSATHISLTKGEYKSSCIDLTFMSYSLLLNTKWQVLDDN
uniref:Endonuclease/exonuclease/phosphatase domain-containing protein n=1 Tax=Trichogramma kaykai TaxID=54128 RepID=A0ABD2XED7_9HYME